MRKLFVLFFCSFFLLNNFAIASNDIHTSIDYVPKYKYKQRTVLKHYDVYSIKITNNNKKALLLTTQTEVLFKLKDGSIITSDTRRTQYRKVRKRDVGRYYWFGIPGSVIGGAITGFTLFLGAPLGAAVAVGMYVPTNKAVRSNVTISQDIFAQNILPIRMESGETYNSRIFIPKKLEIENLIISNVSFDLKDKFDLVIEIGTLCEKY